MAGAKLNTQVRLGAPNTDTPGYFFMAPMGTTRPVDAVAAPDAAYDNMGYLSEDGVEVTTDNGVKKIVDWNLDTILTIQESNEATVKITLMQSSAEVAKAVYGEDNITVEDGVLKAVHYTGDVLPHHQGAWLMKDGNGRMVAEYGDGQVTGLQGLSFVKTEPIVHEIEIELFKAPAVNGKNAFFSIFYEDTAA